MITKLKKFFEENPLAIEAAKSISNGREIAIILSEGEKQTACIFGKQSGKNTFNEGTAKSPDVTFIIPVGAAEDIVTTQFDSVGQVGLRIFEKILSHDPNQKIHIKLHSGILSLVTGGYLGVLTAGGAEVTKFLATKGLGSMGKIKDAIGRMRG